MNLIVNLDVWRLRVAASTCRWYDLVCHLCNRLTTTKQKCLVLELENSRLGCEFVQAQPRWDIVEHFSHLNLTFNFIVTLIFAITLFTSFRAIWTSMNGYALKRNSVTIGIVYTVLYSTCSSEHVDGCFYFLDPHEWKMISKITFLIPWSCVPLRHFHWISEDGAWLGEIILSKNGFPIFCHLVK